MQTFASGMSAAVAGLLLAGCTAGATGSLALPSAFFYLGPRADARVLLDHEPLTRTTATVPGDARKVRVIVKDLTGHIVGGTVFKDIPSSNTLTIDGLPAETELKFDVTVASQVTVEVGRGKKKQTLTAGVSNSIPIPIFMNSGPR